MTQTSFPFPFSAATALIDGTSIRSTETQITLDGSLDIPADQTGRQGARQWAGWWSQVAAAIQENLLPETGAALARPTSAPDTNRSPFVDVSFGINELTVEGASDRIALYGHLSIDKNQVGRDNARHLARLFQSMAVELDRRAERGDLPAVVPTLAPIRKANPLA